MSRARLLCGGKPCDTTSVASKGDAPVNASAHQPPQTVRANGIDICCEIFGNDNAEPLLLIMGLGVQMIHWDDAFCEQLAARGFRVIRFDNRDIGKSSHLTRGKAHAVRNVETPVPEDSGRRDLQADRHGKGYDRPDGCAWDQVGASRGRLDGRHDRAGCRFRSACARSPPSCRPRAIRACRRRPAKRQPC